MHIQTIAQSDTLAGTRTASNAGSRGALWTDRALSTLAVLFLLFDSIGKLMEAPPAVAGSAELGYPAGTVFPIGVILLSCVVTYVIPSTSVLGAVLLTGYLGGAVATHVRAESPLFSHTLFPIYVALFVWGGLFLRDARLRALFPWRIRHSPRTADPANEEKPMAQASSKDGTIVAYERSGKGPALILVDGALCSRAFGPMPKLAPLLAPHFTVYVYDRRGRGQSGDTLPYSKEREVEDIAALIQEAGGSAFLLGLSSGAALALEAAASGLQVKKVAAYEPPYVDVGGHEGGGQRGGAEHERQLKSLLAAGNRAGAVTYFMRSMVGIPAPFVVMMQLMPWIWRKMKAVAHTLPYDAAVMSEFKVPTERLASIKVPTLAMNGSKTDVRLQKATRAVADAVPGAQHRTLAGQTHNVAPGVLTPAVVEFFTADAASTDIRR